MQRYEMGILNKTKNMKKLSSTFTFSGYYQEGSKDRVIDVKLSISYENKTFSITRSNGQNTFDFFTGSHKYPEWRATLDAINLAITFAIEELGFEKPSIKAVQ